MSTESDEPKYLATLVRGKVWSVKDIVFHENCRVVIGDELKARLEDHANDYALQGGDQSAAGPQLDADVVCMEKFYIEPYDGSAKIGTALDKFEDGENDDNRKREAIRQPAVPKHLQQRHRRRPSQTDEEVTDRAVRTNSRVEAREGAGRSRARA